MLGIQFCNFTNHLPLRYDFGGPSVLSIKGYLSGSVPCGVEGYGKGSGRHCHYIYGDGSMGVREFSLEGSTEENDA
jgi:hypothetical protein